MIQDNQYQNLMSVLDSADFKNNHLCEWRWCFVDSAWSPVKIFCNTMSGMLGEKQVIVERIGPRIPQIGECAELEYNKIFKNIDKTNCEIGRHISRDEVFRICREILEKAEQERIDLDNRKI